MANQNVIGNTIPIRGAAGRIRRATSRLSVRRWPAESAAASAAPPGHADPVRLAAKVGRLEAELAAMRARLAELEAHAESDLLTGIMNRRGFERELRHAVAYVHRYGGNCALVYLDLDGFKPVNDRHGHAAGDAVLKAVAAALLGAVRASDAVARIGGDEFAVLLWNLSVQNAASKAEALERAIAVARVPWDGVMLSVGATAGAAELAAGTDVARLVASADMAMYARKRARRAG